MLNELTDSELKDLHNLFQNYKLPENEKRRQDTIDFGYSTKFAMHVVRLALECEQLLLTGELNIEKDSQTLLSIRRGDWSLDDVQKWWAEKERALETAYTNCKVLPHTPDEEKIKQLLLDCIETHYGSLSSAIVRVPQLDALVNDLQFLLDKYKD